ncbi:MAG: hypothetical protein ROO73_00265 [Roseivirga sp.]
MKRKTQLLLLFLVAVSATLEGCGLELRQQMTRSGDEGPAEGEGDRPSVPVGRDTSDEVILTARRDAISSLRTSPGVQARINQLRERIRQVLELCNVTSQRIQEVLTRGGDPEDVFRNAENLVPDSTMANIRRVLRNPTEFDQEVQRMRDTILHQLPELVATPPQGFEDLVRDLTRFHLEMVQEIISSFEQGTSVTDQP